MLIGVLGVILSKTLLIQVVISSTLMLRPGKKNDKLQQEADETRSRIRRRGKHESRDT